MEIEFDGEGGTADLATGRTATTTLEVYQAHPDQIRMALTARASHGEITLGVGMDAEEARRVGEYLIAQATLLEEEPEDEEE